MTNTTRAHACTRIYAYTQGEPDLRPALLVAPSRIELLSKV